MKTWRWAQLRAISETAYMVIISDSVTTWSVAHQAPLSMEFSRQEYWNGLPFPTPGNLPDPGIKTVCLACPTLAGGFFTTSAP